MRWLKRLALPPDALGWRTLRTAPRGCTTGGHAGIVGFGYLPGPGNCAGIALSPAQRMREILFGVPALVSWHLTQELKGSDVGSSD